MTDLRAALRRAVSDTAEPGAAELYPARVGAVVDLFAGLHTRAAGHALLPECRHFCGDLGAPFLAANVRDGIAVLEALAPPTPEQDALCRRLLIRLYRLRDELPGRVH